MNTTRSTQTQPLSKPDNKYVDELLSAFLDDESVSEYVPTPLKVIFVPEHVTPLDVYRKTLMDAGYNEELIDEIIEGLAETPLYEGRTS